jgi:hypothetical protein
MREMVCSLLPEVVQRRPKTTTWRTGLAPLSAPRQELPVAACGHHGTSLASPEARTGMAITSL